MGCGYIVPQSAKTISILKVVLIVKGENDVSVISARLLIFVLVNVKMSIKLKVKKRSVENFCLCANIYLHSDSSCNKGLNV